MPATHPMGACPPAHFALAKGARSGPGNPTLVKNLHNQQTINYGYTYNNKPETITKDGKTLTYKYTSNNYLDYVEDYYGIKTTYQYYPQNGRVQSITRQDQAITYNYTSRGELWKENYGGIQTEYIYNPVGTLFSKENKTTAGTQLSKYTYTYDLLGNQETKKEESPGMAPKEEVYTYDDVGRVKTVDADGTETVYEYDGNGNRDTETITGAENSFTDYIYDLQNKLTKKVKKIGVDVQTTDYDYDPNGNLRTEVTNTIKPFTGGEPTFSFLADDAKIYTYNKMNQLTHFYTNGQTTKYTYGADGLRDSKTSNNITTKYFYNAGMVINEEKNGTLSATNLVGLTGIIGRVTGGTTGYFVKNGHGDVTKAFDSNNNLLASYDYDIWGTEKEATGTFDNPIRYAGEYYSVEMNSYYLRSRDYDPSIGRFMSADIHWNTSNMIYGDSGGTAPSIEAIMQSSNLYVYAMNNPIRYTDPTGRVSKDTADKRIKENAGYIIAAAKEFGVNPAILAATIYAEQRLNVTATEGLEDWGQMMLGLDCSVGISQVRISTAKALEDRGYIEATGELRVYSQWGPFKEEYTVSREERVYNKLANIETNIRYAAAELKYRQDLWKEQYPEVDGRTAILATLYNRGDDAGTPHSNPKSNEFGDFAKANYYHMRSLLGLD